MKKIVVLILACIFSQGISADIGEALSALKKKQNVNIKFHARELNDSFDTEHPIGDHTISLTPYAFDLNDNKYLSIHLNTDKLWGTKIYEGLSVKTNESYGPCYRFDDTNSQSFNSFIIGVCSSGEALPVLMITKNGKQRQFICGWFSVIGADGRELIPHTIFSGNAEGNNILIQLLDFLYSTYPKSQYVR